MSVTVITFRINKKNESFENSNCSTSRNFCALAQLWLYDNLCDCKCVKIKMTFTMQLEHTNELQRNELTLERIVCPVARPNIVAHSVHCRVKYIDWNRNLKVQINFNITKPLNHIWLHTMLYYKFNGLVYSKFPIDLWYNICEWQDKRLTGRLTRVEGYASFKRLLDMSSLNHSCPFVGYYSVDVKNMSMEAFPFEPLLPSGRYRFDMAYSEKFHGYEFYTSQIYFSVSDYRLVNI